MLLGGAQAEALAQRLRGYGMDAKCVSEKLGVASAIKMCSSVMIKGQKALVIESYATAGAYGVEDHVLPTLIETFPSIDRENRVPTSSAACCSTASAAPKKCAAANTVREAGFEPFVAPSCRSPISATCRW